MTVERKIHNNPSKKLKVSRYCLIYLFFNPNVTTCISENFIKVKINLKCLFSHSLDGLHKTFRGITKKCKNKNLTQFSFFVRDRDWEG